MVQKPKGPLVRMGYRPKARPMVIPARQMPKLPSREPDSGPVSPTPAQEQPKHEDLRPVLPEPDSPVVPDRQNADTTARTPDTRGESPDDTLHIALVIPDLRIFQTLKSSAYVLKPHDHDQAIKLHVLLQKKNEDPQSIIFRFALTQLGMVTPEVAQLDYPEEMELGFSDDLT